MKIVIELPEDDYKRIVKEGMTAFGSDADIALLEQALESGVVLPKGHGALKDIDAIIAEHAMTKYDWSDCVDIEDLRNFPTIIEADKEGSEEYHG